MRYFKCKRCYSLVHETRIVRHHTKVHPNVPHEYYVDNYFDFHRELHKCKYCSCKLPLKQLNKHLQRAHLNINHVFKPNSLLFERALKVLDSGITTTTIEISSDSEIEFDQLFETKTSVDVAIQCELIPNDTEGACKEPDSNIQAPTIDTISVESIGSGCVSKDSSVDPAIGQPQHGEVSTVIETKEIATQTSSVEKCEQCKMEEATENRMNIQRAQKSMEPTEKRMQLSIEIDDGELLLVLN
ncbi:uncharacterized protein LOC116349761 [Contarinia nasturtii]|uniref:uncharacterized protein LOC116349761 n=1 Tax=Contarinia nasturtii TaxID=265458 RepID=UPI0012D4643D|nr:uncharacterized protein LOC116349761 [Contarinia nasturtii]XP_031637205.1 uncharacterized protein LOC116349761 [Contarinia nasturtii]